MPKHLPDDLPKDSQDDQASTGTIAQPDLSEKPAPKNRSIRDVKQAQNIITTLEVANRERNIKNARIMMKYNSERPYPQQMLENDGLGWKSNFTTQPLPTLIDKVAPRFVQAVDGMKYLTNSSLPDDEPGSAEKTEAFRREITDTIRARPEWRSFVAEFSQENALFGYCAVAQLDEFVWFPEFFRQDQFFIPTGTKQTPSQAQIVVLKKTYLIHELFKLIEDRDVAEKRGWNVPNTVKAINDSMPEDRRRDNLDLERVYQDLIRESAMGDSYETGARVVVVWHLLATEVTGKVSQYMFTDQGFQEIFTSEDQFDSMADAVSFFSFQQGNGTMHGSKGIGRQIYAIAGIVDRNRNEVVDKLNLAGKVIIQGDPKALAKFKMQLVGNAILIQTGVEVLERKIDPAVEPSLQLDDFLTRLLDQMSGATTPKVFEGERVTKAQVDLFAAREEESRDTIMGRFLNQFAAMMTTIQKRMCDANTSEKDAKDMQKRLLEIMDRKDLDRLAKQVVAETVKDYTDQERQQVVLVAAEAAGNPLYNQRELQYRKLSAQINEEFAQAVLLPEEDPTVTAEQTRLQMLENLIIVGQGSEVPVSPRDNDLVHLEVLMPALEQLGQQAVKDPAADETMEAVLKHAEAHVAAAESKGVDKKQIAEQKKILVALRKNLQALYQNGLQQAQLAGAPPPQPPAPPA